MTYADNPKVREAFYAEDNDFTRAVKFYGIVGGDIRAMAECVAAAVHEASRETDAEPVAWAVVDTNDDIRGVHRLEAYADSDAYEWAFSADGQRFRPFAVVPLYRHPAPRVAAPTPTREQVEALRIQHRQRAPLCDEEGMVDGEQCTCGATYWNRALSAVLRLYDPPTGTER